jgi:hypothetical protein
MGRLEWAALAYTREHRIRNWEALIARDAARLDAVHGELEEGLALFETTINSFHGAGDHANVMATLANLAVFFERFDQPETAAILYGTCTDYGIINSVINLAAVVDDLRGALGDRAFDNCVAIGRSMEYGDAAQYARDQIHTARRHAEASQ